MTTPTGDAAAAAGDSNSPEKKTTSPTKGAAAKKKKMATGGTGGKKRKQAEVTSAAETAAAMPKKEESADGSGAVPKPPPSSSPTRKRKQSPAKAPTKKAPKSPTAKKETDATATAPTTTTSSPPKKKRKSKPASSDAGKKAAGAGTSSSSAGASTAATAGESALKSKAAVPSAPPPTRILVIDNGGDTVKFGWSTSASIGGDAPERRRPERLPNATARLPQQWTVLAGDQLTTTVQNPNQLIGVTRSTERGVVVNLGNQVQVWKRVLDLLGVSVPVHTETAHAFGWNQQQKRGAGSKRKNAAMTSASAEGGADKEIILPGPCAVLLAVPPHCPRSVLDQIATVWFDDFGFGRVGFCCSSAAAAGTGVRIPAAIQGDECDTGDAASDFGTVCIVDIGWSGIHIVPTFRGRPIPEAIRRVPIGGRHLINIWKYYGSYRQWNLMDQDWILQDCLEKTGYVALHFRQDMDLARKVPGGRRPFDREYVLPDYQTKFEGEVRLPAALQQLEEEEQRRRENAMIDEIENDEDDDEEDESVDEEEMERAAAKDEEEDDVADSDEDEEVDEDEEESPEEIRRRIMKQRAEEERRRREIEEQQQVLHISTERFAVPEVLFSPSDAGLPSDWASLPAAIVQSIEACPKALQPAMYQSLWLVGGLSQLSGLPERLHQELRALAPCEFQIELHFSESPEDEAWYGACKLAKEEMCDKWSISRRDWESISKRGISKRLDVSRGGHLV